MKKVRSYNELSKLISEQLRKGVWTNCFISSEEFENEIARGRLYFQSYNGCLLLFRKMPGYFKMNFYINNFDFDICFRFHKRIVVEVVENPEHLSDKIINFFERNGMHVVLKRERLTCGIDSCQLEFPNKIKNIKFATLKEYAQIVKILRENFDKYIGCIPVKEKIKQDIIDQNFYCYQENRKVLGLLQISNGKGTSEIKHLVVKNEARNRGIASELLANYILDTTKLKKSVWTSKDNEVAKQIYKKFGYLADGYTSKVLVYERK